MCYFLGNDFLPHIPSLDISHGGIEMLMRHYINTITHVDNMGQYIVCREKSGKVDINNKLLSQFLDKLANDEEKILTEHYEKGRRYMKCDSSDPYDMEVHKIDNLQFKIIDPIKLGSGSMEEWRMRYYKHYWDIDADELEEFSMKMVQNYMIGIKWVSLYYFDECPSWSWYYPYDHPPFISDIAKYSKNFKVSFELGKPLKPFMQLLAVLPPQSNFLLPPSIRKLVLDPRSSLSYAYPMEFTQDFINKHKYWMGIPNLPPLDMELLKHSYKKYEDELSKEEKFRNEYCEVIKFNK